MDMRRARCGYRKYYDTRNKTRRGRPPPRAGAPPPPGPRATREARELKVRRLEGRRRWYWSRPFARSRRRDRLPHMHVWQRLCRGIARKATGGMWAIFTAAETAHVYLPDRLPHPVAVALQRPGATSEFGIEPVSVHVCHASAAQAVAAIRAEHFIRAMRCAVLFDTFECRVPVETAMDELVGVA